MRRKEKELVARVQLPADAQAYQICQVNDHLIMMIFGQLLNNDNGIWRAPKKNDAAFIELHNLVGSLGFDSLLLSDPIFPKRLPRGRESRILWWQRGRLR